jgi:uncharacterized protein YjeT (DUF2065 family)
MDIIIKSIGIIFVLIGIFFFLKPDVLKQITAFFAKDIRIYLAGIVRLILAVIFLIGARECKNFWVIFTLGILFLVSGLLIFVLGPKRLSPMVTWFQKQTALLLRIITILIMIIGIIIIYFA